MWQHLQKTLQRWNRDEGSLLAAAVAYYAAVSFFPLMMVLIAGVGAFLQWTRVGQNAEQEVLKVIGAQLSPAVEQHARQALAQVRQNAAVTGPWGGIMLLLAATALFAQFERAFDRIWSIEGEKASAGPVQALRNFLRHRFRAFLMLFSLGAVVAMIFAVGLVFSAMKTFTLHMLPLERWVLWAAHTASTMLLNGLVFALVYKMLPKVPVSWPEAMRGGTLAAVTWEIGRQVLALYVIGEKYSAYGVIGSMLAIILWIYYAVSVVFFGAEYVQVFRERHHSAKGDRSPNAAAANGTCLAQRDFKTRESAWQPCG
jgi:membrane protein